MTKASVKGYCEKCGSGSFALLRRGKQWLCHDCAGGSHQSQGVAMSIVSTDDRDIDIVDRLRLGGPNAEAVSGQAADEIERLRAAVAVAWLSTAGMDGLDQVSVKVLRAAVAAEREACLRPFRNADALDWEHLFKMLPESGHGQFWKAVLNEMRAVIARGTE